MQFVLLEHTTAEGVHWDLMVEMAEGAARLKTWRLERCPIGPFGEIAVAKLQDHRREYLDYEGPISGERGSVRRLDRGLALVSRVGEDWRLRLTGAELSGVLEVVTGPHGSKIRRLLE